ncbi:MAG: hypothetical protein GEU78_18110 [Actinobacteria bacterium]|nr:hypothetical protein [Actinomycetota bacterium]
MTTHTNEAQSRKPVDVSAHTHRARSRLVQMAVLSAVVAVAAAILKGLAGAGVAEAILTAGGAFGSTMGLGLAVTNVLKR